MLQLFEEVISGVSESKKKVLFDKNVRWENFKTVDLRNCCQHSAIFGSIDIPYEKVENVFGEWTLPLARLLIQDEKVFSKWAPTSTKSSPEQGEIKITWCKEDLEIRVEKAYEKEERRFFAQVINFWSELEGSEWHEGFYFHWIYIVYRLRTILENNKEKCGKDFWICIRHFIDGAQFYGFWDELLNQVEGNKKEEEIQKIPHQIRRISELKHEDKQALLTLMIEIFSNPQWVNGVGDWEYYNNLEAPSPPASFEKKKESGLKVRLIAGIALTIFGIIGALYYYGKLDRLKQYTKDLGC